MAKKTYRTATAWNIRIKFIGAKVAVNFKTDFSYCKVELLFPEKKAVLNVLCINKRPYPKEIIFLKGKSTIKLVPNSSVHIHKFLLRFFLFF